MKLSFTEEELVDMRSFMEKVADRQKGARHTDLIVAVFHQRFEETFKFLNSMIMEAEHLHYGYSTTTW
jgi:iron-sulfur cluster repair protein YtfE (RIC family)